MPTKEYRIPKRIENENTMSATLNDTNGEDPNPRTATKMPAQIKSKFGFSRSNKTIPLPKSNIVGGGQQQQQRQHFQDISNNSGDINGENLNKSSRGSMIKIRRMGCREIRGFDARTGPYRVGFCTKLEDEK